MTKNTYKARTEKKPAKKLKFNIAWVKDRRFQLVFGFFLLGFSLFLFISFISYLFTGKSDQSVVGALGDLKVSISGAEVENWLGITGAYLSHLFIFKWFGLASFLVPPLSFIMGFKVISGKEILPINRSISFVLFFLFWISILTGNLLIASDEVSSWGYLSGGIGYELAILFDGLLGWGTFIFLILFFLTFNIYFFNISWKFENKIDDEENESISDGEKEKSEIELESADQDDIRIEQVLREIEFDSDMKIEPAGRGNTEDLELEVDIPDADDGEMSDKDDSNVKLEIDDTITEETSDKLENYDPTLDLGSYKYPTPDLLDEYPDRKVQVTKDELEQNKDKIIETLINFKIGISSIKATIGPTVTLYEIVPDAGIKISKIKNLEDDIALSLAALGIRIIAPIPGKGTIGIEVPNKNREMVSMRSVISTEKFMKSDMALPVILGKTISNEVYITDLAKMPHLLMAGATGQGKSVGLNVMLASLIYKKHPSQLKFILIDPKKVELTIFNTIERHFLAKLPDSDEAIITDTKKVVNTLNSLCIEMDSRYDLLKEAACRNIKEYNEKFVKRRLNPNKGHKFLPYIVLVVDELADLMMTAGKEVEAPIARLAQLARAIGIHLVIATQRPSVNVITGVIKANFPARLSFRVTSKIDSRTILDTGGAEQLVGMGDMLLSLGSDIIRLQCPFIDTPEVYRLCEFVGAQRGYASAYHLPEFSGDEDSGSALDVDLSDRDALFEEAARLIVVHQQGSTSLIQRKMKLGYNRAGRLIDQLEAAGIVGTFEGSKAREVLIPDEYSLEQLLNSLDD
ncbi:MAG: DNA translocase FtsK [Bacteroidetes bacterium]|nr:DNA translocase FtsK [Bacteroidota bacterium]MDA1121048.1 DNA translocase FtsK [Bacteroidota bacterium]